MSGVLLAGRYRLLETLGEGGAGTVWRARDEMLHRDVAVKDVRVPAGLGEDARRAFGGRAIQEARSAARLSHPAIVVIHDVVLDGDRPWIVMDLVGGRSLDRAIRSGGALPAHHVAEIGLRVLGALSAAHAQGILHQDVKPANVLLDEDGRAMLADFGIAVPTASPERAGEAGDAGQAEPTASFASAGSPGYAAPERLSGAPTTPASDLWSLGATLYTAVEGRAPFQRDLPAAVVAAVLFHDPPAPMRAGPVLGPLLLAMLAKDPAARPSPETVRETLRGIASRGGTTREMTVGVPSPHPPTAPPTAPPTLSVPSASPQTPPARRKPALIAGGALLALVATGAVGWLALRPEAVANAGRFPTAPRPCGLLTDAQAGELLGGPTDTATVAGECAWRFRKNGIVWRTITVRLRAEQARDGGSGPDAARLSFSGRRSARASMRGTAFPETTYAVRDVRGTGDEAFAQDVSNAFQKSTTSTVWFRTDNLITEVEYHRLDGPKVTPAARRTAERAARLAADAIGRS
ncbi:serine/threonine-protein kinase [Microtetraspora glauca]|uniref:non-specific serine/threonine protein kinase n=1 Tax=Microtetraspora glauca TaxID=1996 RepID=A0ABV3GTJ5_MICGL